MNSQFLFPKLRDSFQFFFDFRLSVFLLVFLFTGSLKSQTQTFYFIGDAGEDTVPGAALKKLEQELLKNPEATVVFLGDNVYFQGLNEVLNDKKISICEKKLLAQLQILKKFRGNAYFIPGNHDWKAGKWAGLEWIKSQGKYVDQYLRDSTQVKNRNTGGFFPRDGMPGPYTISMGPKLKLLLFDTQWFLQRPGGAPVGVYPGFSKRKTAKMAWDQVDSTLKAASLDSSFVIFAAHHPVYTNGHHSRRKQPLRFLINYTPLQIFGLMGMNRWLRQDMDQPCYKKMRKHLGDALSKYKNVLYVSGHDHNFQHWHKDGKHYLVSGCGSKITPLCPGKKDPDANCSDAETGFVKVLISRDKEKLDLKMSFYSSLKEIPVVFW